MNKKILVTTTIFILVIVGVSGYFAWRNHFLVEDSSIQRVGGEQDEHGCLVAAGYGFDTEVSACIRAFEMTSDIKRAAQLAVKNVGETYALTVVSFNSYEEVGAYDITLERGLDRKKETVHIKNWQVVSVDQINPTAYPNTQRAIQNILAKKYDRPLSEVKVIVDKEVQGFARGSVLFGQGGPGEGGIWLAVLGNGWSVVWDGNGNVDCNKMRQEYYLPDAILVPNLCQSLESTVVEAVRTYAAAKAGISKDAVATVSSSPKNWSDSCLGLGGPAESCLAAITPGYEVTVKVNGVKQTYRTNADGSEIRRQIN